LSLLPKWVAAGVTSIKINGRTKPVEWTVEVTRVYREAIDYYQESPGTWRVRPEWLRVLGELVPEGGNLDVMPDPLVEVVSDVH